MSRGWRNVLYSVSLFLFSMLSVKSNAQTVSDSASINNSRSKVEVSGPKPAAGDMITGRVCNSEGPMMMARVEEKDSENRLVAHAVTDIDGNPLIILDGNVMNLDREKLNDFDFTTDSFSKDKVAELLGIESDQIKNISILTNTAATKKWGNRGANGVLEVTSKKNNAR